MLVIIHTDTFNLSSTHSLTYSFIRSLGTYKLTHFITHSLHVHFLTHFNHIHHSFNLFFNYSISQLLYSYILVLIYSLIHSLTDIQSFALLPYSASKSSELSIDQKEEKRKGIAGGLRNILRGKTTRKDGSPYKPQFIEKERITHLFTHSLTHSHSPTDSNFTFYPSHLLFITIVRPTFPSPFLFHPYLNGS